MGMMDSTMAFLQSLQGLPAYGLVLAVLVGLGFGLPMNEDLLLLVAAGLTLKGVMDPVPLIAVAWAGLMCADGLIFYWGRRFGPRLLRRRWFARMLPEPRLDAMRQALRRYGAAAILTVRFMPGLRTPLLFTAGTLQMPVRQWLVFDGAAALVELPLLVYGVRYLGGRWQEILGLLQRFQAVLVPAVLMLAVGAWLYGRRRRARASGA